MKSNAQVVAFIRENSDKGYEWLSKELNYTLTSLYCICSKNKIKIKKKPMPKYKYSPEIIDFIKSNTDKGYKWIWEHLKEDYKFNITFHALQTYCKKHKIKVKDINIKYTPEIVEFIKNNADKGYEYLLSELNTTYKLNSTPKSLQAICQRNEIIVKPKKKWSDEVIQFVRDNTDKTYSELVEEIEKRFGIKTNRDSFLGVCQYYDIKCTHAQKLSEGTESTHVTGLSFVKVGNQMIKKSRYVYEQHYGPIPKGYSIIHLDGDRSNCNIENLRCISRGVLCRIKDTYGLGIITEAMIEICTLEEDLMRLKNGSN